MSVSAMLPGHAGQLPAIHQPGIGGGYATWAGGATSS